MTQLSNSSTTEQPQASSRLQQSLPVMAEPELPPPTSGWLSAQRILLYFVFIVALVWLGSGFYQVGAGEVGVVERLGQYVAYGNGKPVLEQPGLHYHLPWPIDRVYMVPLLREQILEVNNFNRQPASYIALKRVFLRNPLNTAAEFDAIFDPYVITGDKNVLHMQIAVHFHISDPVAWLTHVYEPPGDTTDSGELALLKMLAARDLIHQMAYTTVDEALYGGKAQIQTELYNPAQPQGGMQAAFDRLALGVQMERAQIDYVHWPMAADQAFNAVLNDRQQAQADIERAKTQANHLTTYAQGQAEARINAAQAYANQVEQQATGEANAFTLAYQQYQKNPRVISLKLLSDTLGQVMNNVSRVYFVQPGQKMVLTLPPPQHRIIVPQSSLSAPPPNE